MPILNESIVEEAALEWFGELGYAIGHGSQPTPGEPATERDSFAEVVQSHFGRTLIPAFSQQVKERRAAIRRLNLGHPEEARATIRDFQIVENSTRREMKP